MRLLGPFGSLLPRPPMMVARQHAPRSITLPADFVAVPPLQRFGIVTPSFNQGQFIGRTIESVLRQDYANLAYHVQDGGSTDETVAVLGDSGVSWTSEPDAGQADAINRGFVGMTCDIMAYLNSDDILLPGTLAYVAEAFKIHPDVDIIYGNRIFIDQNGDEIGRAVLPGHDAEALRHVDIVPQETMFWRASVWDAVGPFDPSLRFALDWDFLLRAQQAGFKLMHLPRFLGGFRVHGDQKTTVMSDVGNREIAMLKRAHAGSSGRVETLRRLAPYLARQLACHWLYRLGLARGDDQRGSPAPGQPGLSTPGQVRP
jgi:hypothetical protein